MWFELLGILEKLIKSLIQCLDLERLINFVCCSIKHPELASVVVNKLYGGCMWLLSLWSSK